MSDGSTQQGVMGAASSTGSEDPMKRYDRNSSRIGAIANCLIPAARRKEIGGETGLKQGPSMDVVSVASDDSGYDGYLEEIVVLPVDFTKTTAEGKSDAKVNVSVSSILSDSQASSNSENTNRYTSIIKRHDEDV
jgi:hypothetical protein